MRLWKLSAALLLTLSLTALPVHRAWAGDSDEPEAGSKDSAGALVFVQRPLVVLRSADDTQTKTQRKPIDVASGSRIFLPGDWGPQGFLRVIIDRVPRPVRVLEWGEAGITAQLPVLSLSETTDAKLVVVRDNKRSFPPISLKLLASSAKPAAEVILQDAPTGTFEDVAPESK